MTTGALPLLLLEKVSPKRSASISLKSEGTLFRRAGAGAALVDARAASEVGVGDVSATNGGALAKGSSGAGLTAHAHVSCAWNSQARHHPQ